MDMETLLYNAIICWFDENIENYGTIDNEDWIVHVCTEIGLKVDEYKKIMLGVC